MWIKIITDSLLLRNLRIRSEGIRCLNRNIGRLLPLRLYRLLSPIVRIFKSEWSRLGILRSIKSCYCSLMLIVIIRESLFRILDLQRGLSIGIHLRYFRRIRILGCIWILMDSLMGRIGSRLILGWRISRGIRELRRIRFSI